MLYGKPSENKSNLECIARWQRQKNLDMKALMIADWNSALQQRGHWADRRGDAGAYRTRKPILKPTTKDNESTVDGGGDNYTLTGRPNIARRRHAHTDKETLRESSKWRNG